MMLPFNPLVFLLLLLPPWNALFLGCSITFANASISTSSRKKNQATSDDGLGQFTSSNRGKNNLKQLLKTQEEEQRESQRRFANQTAQNVTFLLDHLLQQYDNSLRPDIRGPPLVVEINMQVRSMGPISEIDMSYSMDCYFRQSWVDTRLAFSGRKNLALSIEMLRKIWKPDTYIFNGRKSYLHTITTPNKFMRLFPNGRVLYSQRLTIRASCQMDLSHFPMDMQSCPLSIGSFGYSKDDVEYRWTKGRGVNIASDMKMSQFDLIKTPTGNATVEVNKGIHSSLQVQFKLQRHMGNFVIQVYGPCVLLVVISWVSFWLNREATSDRISLGVTTVLTMTFLGLEARTDLPQVAYPTALDYFVFISFMFIFSTVVQFALVHYFTKLGAGEYYLEELEETICMAEQRIKQKRLERDLVRENGRLGLQQDENNLQDSGEVSMEDGTSFSGNSNNVFTTSGGGVGGGQGVGGPGNAHGGVAGGVIAGGEHLMMSSSAASTAKANNSSSNCHNDAATNNRLMFTIGSYEDSSFFPIFDNTILIDPVQRQREHFGQQAAAIYSENHRSVVRHNCLNHHPYGTFYYSKKNGKTGRHFPDPVPPPILPNSPTLNSHHHTVMAGGGHYSPVMNRTTHSEASNVRTSSAQSSTNSSKRRQILDWAKSWNRYKRRERRTDPVLNNTSSTQSQTLNQNPDRILEECQCKRCITRAMNNPEKALNSVSQIDKISRIVFPLAFALLNGCYWFNYLKVSARIDLNFESA